MTPLYPALCSNWQSTLHGSILSCNSLVYSGLNLVCVCVCVCTCACVCVPSCFSHVWLFETLWTNPIKLLCPWDSPGKNTGMGCHALLQGIFSTQGSNPHLLHCRWTLYHWDTKEAPESQTKSQVCHRFMDWMIHMSCLSLIFLSRNGDITDFRSFSW